MEYLWGIDLGGTKIEGVVLPRGSIDPLARVRVPTDAEKGYEQILKNVERLVDQLRQETSKEPDKIGIGTPGVIDPNTGALKNSNTQCLNGRPFQEDLETRLGYEVVTANDANCFALAEQQFGAAAGAQCCFGVILGTGVGGGIVLDGKARFGLHGIAGEWGHIVIEPGGNPCYCGKQGCVETVISGPALEKFYLKQSGEIRTLVEIAERAVLGNDRAAEVTIDRLCTFFGRSIAHVVNILDPEVIVLGGGVSNIHAIYDRGVEELKEYIFNDKLDTRVVQNRLGDSAGVFGAAMLVG